MDERRDEMSKFTLGELLEAQNVLGVEETRKILLPNAQDDTPLDKGFQSYSKAKEKFRTKKVQKDEPLEVSSKIKRKQNFTNKAERAGKIDPRFHSEFGKFHDKKFSRNYEFVSDLANNEINMLKKRISKVKNQEIKEELRKTKHAMENRFTAQKDASLKKEAFNKIQTKQDEIKKKSGKDFFAKKNVYKKTELALKFAQLQKEGKLDKYMDRRRKKVDIQTRKRLQKHIN